MTLNNIHFVTHRTVSHPYLRDTNHVSPASVEVITMWLPAHTLKMVSLSVACALLLCAGCAYAGDGGELSLTPARPTLGSMDCLRPAGIMSPACPYEIASPNGSQQNINPSEIGTHRVLRLLASERLHKRFRFLKPYNPLSIFTLPNGFSSTIVMGYPGANMHIDLQNFDVDMQLFGGGTVRPFNNDDPYAVMRFSWNW